ncbi:AMP-binding protein [Mesorhizobium sp. BHbdii]
MSEARAIADLLAQDFGTLPAMIGHQAAVRPDRVALIHGERQLTYRELGTMIDRVAKGLQRDAIEPQQVIAVCALSSIEYVATFMGALRAGVVVAPLAPSSTAESLATMIADSGARLLFLDRMVAQSLDGVRDEIAARRIALDGSEAGETFEAWLPGTTGTPRASFSRTPCAGSTFAVQPSWAMDPTR